MALTKCPECAHEISDTARTCPKCGAKVEKKKTGCFVWIVVIVILFWSMTQVG